MANDTAATPTKAVGSVATTLGFGKIMRKASRFVQVLRWRNQTPRQIFTEIYQKNTWNNRESVSGSGSSLAETQHLRVELAELFRRYDIRTITDLPCGDFNWFKEIDHQFDRYVGCDIVNDMIANNQRIHGRDRREFQTVDAISEPVTGSDLLFCRDMIIHLSQRDIFRFFANIRSSGFEWLLLSNYQEVRNKNVATGRWRPVNLLAAPYHFPEPEETIFEDTAEDGGKWRDVKTMALWRADLVFETLQRNPNWPALDAADHGRGPPSNEPPPADAGP